MVATANEPVVVGHGDTSYVYIATRRVLRAYVTLCSDVSGQPIGPGANRLS